MNNIITFLLGAAIGSLITWRLMKTKHELIEEDETIYVQQENGEPVVENFNNDLRNTDSINKAINIAKKSGYMNYSTNKNEEKEEEKMKDRPYVITPEEFGDCYYEIVLLTYFADGYLADEEDNIVDEVDETIGYDSLNHFGEYEEDIVYVRNDKRKCDYQVINDFRNYKDVCVEDEYEE